MKVDKIMIEMIKSYKKQLKYEKCILCGNLTDIQVDTPVKEREHYIETSGQLCRKCYFETYVRKSR